MIFRTFGAFLIFLGVVSMCLRRTRRREKTELESFWKQEDRANLTQAQDLSTLNYVDLSGVTLPFAKFEDAQLKDYEQQILALRNEKILNLSGLSNTDLKLQYGSANLGLLTRYDQNFILLVRTLNQWGHRLYALSHKEEAAAVLQLAVSVGTDVKASYELLLRIYQESGNSSGIEDLKHSAEKLTTIRKDSILAMLGNA